MKKFIVAFLKDEEGLTMVEYAIAGALVSIAAVTAFTNLVSTALREQNHRPRNCSNLPKSAFGSGAASQAHRSICATHLRFPIEASYD